MRLPDPCGAPPVGAAGDNFPAAPSTWAQRRARALQVAVLDTLYLRFVLRHVGAASRNLRTFEGHGGLYDLAISCRGRRRCCCAGVFRRHQPAVAPACSGKATRALRGCGPESLGHPWRLHSDAMPDGCRSGRLHARSWVLLRCSRQGRQEGTTVGNQASSGMSDSSSLWCRTGPADGVATCRHWWPDGNLRAKRA